MHGQRALKVLQSRVISDALLSLRCQPVNLLILFSINMLPIRRVFQSILDLARHATIALTRTHVIYRPDSILNSSFNASPSTVISP